MSDPASGWTAGRTSGHSPWVSGRTRADRTIDGDAQRPRATGRGRPQRGPDPLAATAGSAVSASVRQPPSDAWRSRRPASQFVRLVGVGLAIIPLLVGFLPVLVDDRRRGLRDFLAGTVVLTEGPGPLAALPPASER